jgi:hypothetical protein
MKDSKVNTIAIPRLTFVDNELGQGLPATLWHASKVPERVLVRNISNGLDVIIAYDAATLQTLPAASNTYTLPAGSSDVFVLAPKQALYAISLGDGARLCLAISDALPIDMKE